MIHVDAVILASGLSRRMGSVNKLLLKYEGETLIEKTVKSVLKANCFKNIIVVINDKEVEDVLSKYDVKTIFNPNNKNGKSEAIKLGVKMLGESDGTMFLVGDQPFLDYESILKIWVEFIQHKESVIIPYIDGSIGNPVIFPKALYGELANLNGEQGGMKILNGNFDTVRKVVLSNEKVFYDIDTKEDYELLISNEI